MNQRAKNRVEFYLEASYQPFLTLDAEFQPQEGDYININKITYKVTGRSFTVDHAESIWERSMRCNVIVEKCA